MVEFKVGSRHELAGNSSKGNWPLWHIGIGQFKEKAAVPLANGKARAPIPLAAFSLDTGDGGTPDTSFLSGQGLGGSIVPLACLGLLLAIVPS